MSNPESPPDSSPKPFGSFSAFGATLGELRQLVREIQIDHRSLNRPLTRCDLGRCRGTCCHDGVYLDQDEVGILAQLLDDHRSDFEALGALLPDQPIVPGHWRDTVSGPKTATRPEPMSERADGYPSHFPNTACVLLLPDARCALQQFAADQGLDPWFYKPATCWLHPLSIQPSNDGPATLTLHDRENDPQRFPDYDGFSSRTACGVSPQTGGKPAWEVLSPELERLGVIGGRDLIGEIRSALN